MELKELRVKAKKFYEENELEVLFAFITTVGIMGAYTFGLWRGRAEGLTVGSSALVKMTEQINKIESK